MEQNKRGRGRPKIDTHITEAYASSRRQAVNAVYMYEGVDLISVAATEIPVLRCLHSNGRRETRHLGAAWANADTRQVQPG